MNHKNNVILHDYMAVREGGGKVATNIAKYLNLDLVTGCISTDLRKELRSQKLVVKSLGNCINSKFVRAANVYRLWKNFESESKRLIYSGHFSPLAVMNHQNCYNVYYCHTPPRFVFDQYLHFLKLVPPPIRPVYKKFVQHFKGEYLEAISAMNTVLVNSKNVKDRLKQYTGIDAEIVYPPCETANFFYDSPRGYYLSTARLDPLKRVDRIIEAFTRMPDKKLVVLSDGTERKRLRSLAALSSNIQLIGEVSERRLYELISQCIATIYIPADEDFGLSPVESMAAGKPVIGVKEGGLRETLIDGITGVLLEKNPSSDDIVSVVQFMTPKNAVAMREACMSRAALFSSERFVRKIRKIFFIGPCFD